MLIALVAAAFAPVRHNGWVPFDDPAYVVDNERVMGGLSWAGARWAVNAVQAYNWHPLTWLSHMFDVTLFGEDWGAHHLVSVALHGATVVLLFLWLASTTAEPALAFAAAVLFGVHPQRVESVAWLAERKDTLSALLALVTIVLYTGWARERRRRAGWYAAALGAFAAGLFAKPMLVTLPLLLVLADAWPLGRFRALRELPARVGEKAPFFVLSVAVAFGTIVAQARIVKPLATHPLGERLANACLAPVLYLADLVWPVGLAVFYPYDIARRPGWQITLAAVALAVTTGLLVHRALRARSAGAVLVGWIWYLVALVPVIGLVQVGLQARADRYTYLPGIGIAWALAWGIRGVWVSASARLPRLLGVAPVSRTVVVLGAALVLALVLVPLTRAQVRTWRDGETLYRHAAARTRANDWAHYNLGQVLMRQQRNAEALAEFLEVVRLVPEHAEAQRNAGILLQELGRQGEARPYFERAAALRPGDLFAQRDHGRYLIAAGVFARARGVLERTLALDRSGELESMLGYVLLRLGDGGAAGPVRVRALERRPDDAVVHNSLGVLLAQRGELERAAQHLRRAVALAPDNADALANLGAVEAALRNTTGARP